MLPLVRFASRNASALCLWIFLVTCLMVTQRAGAAGESEKTLTLAREGNWLIVQGPEVPGNEIRINYLEAYCRPDSTDADWVEHTLVGHQTELISLNEERNVMKLRCTLSDGVVVDHVITAGPDEVDFRLVAHNPTDTRSEAHWAQPCVRVGPFTGFTEEGIPSPEDYLEKSFIFLEGELARMPTAGWATEARYTPGQVWRPEDVPPSDVNPRPLNPLIPSAGLIGCFSEQEDWIFATAWEPYQELFQGVARCLHSDFRLGGLKPGETKRIRGKIYLVPNDVPALVERYEDDFPEHRNLYHPLVPLLGVCRRSPTDF
ncbi:MAG: hypothetical protein WD490_10530 [Opitutales bacterium]